MQNLTRNAFALAFVALAACGAPFGVQYGLGNVHRVNQDLYRSGQLSGDGLDALIRRTGIRSVINLRGDHPGLAWWEAETAAARRHGVAYRSVAISARSVPDQATMEQILALMEDMPKPILVHCNGGSDRSGLASAIYELAVEGDSTAEASQQLSLRYGHFPWLGSRTSAMDEAFTRFAERHGAEGPVVAEKDAAANYEP